MRCRLLLLCCALTPVLAQGPSTGTHLLAVAPFEDSTDGEQGYRVARLLSEQLQGSYFQTMTALDVDRLVQGAGLATRNPQLFRGALQAERLAHTIDTGVVVLGRLSQAQGNYTLQAECLDTQRDCIVANSQVKQTGPDLEALVDNVAGTLHAKLTGGADVGAESEERLVRNDNSDMQLNVRFEQDLERQERGLLPIVYENELVRLSVNSSETGYLLAVNVGADGVYQLFPPCPKLVPRIQKGVPLGLPSPDFSTCNEGGNVFSTEGFEAWGQQQGIEYIHVFFSRRPIPLRIADPRLEAKAEEYNPSRYRAEFLPRLRAELTRVDPQWNGTVAKYYYGVNPATAIADLKLTPPPQPSQPPAAPTSKGVEGGSVSAALERGREIVVEAVGVAALQGDAAKARDIALLDARRNALEQALGSMVKSSSRVEDYRLIEDSINVRSETGFVRIKKVLEEEQRDGAVVVKVSAAVSTMPVVSRLTSDEELRDLYEQMERPRVVCMIEEDAAGEKNAKDSATATQIINYLINAGFDVRDAAQIANLAERDKVTQALLGNAEAAEWIRSELEAELIIGGTAKASIQSRNAAANTATALTELNLRVVNASDARILVPCYQPFVSPPQAAGGNDSITCRAALREAVKEAFEPREGNGLLDRLLGAWISRPTVFTVRLSKVDRDGLNKLVQVLEPQPVALREVTVDMTKQETSFRPSLITAVRVKEYNPAVSKIEVETLLRPNSGRPHVFEALGKAGLAIQRESGTIIDAARG
ncbi:MAG: hypothetical protein HUU35_00560 [Armatimonadetes bacterium]|nr:hypothetical protein [Armatimonadota bacterium]